MFEGLEFRGRGGETAIVVQTASTSIDSAYPTGTSVSLPEHRLSDSTPVSTAGAVVVHLSSGQTGTSTVMPSSS